MSNNILNDILNNLKSRQTNTTNLDKSNKLIDKKGKANILDDILSNVKSHDKDIVFNNVASYLMKHHKKIMNKYKLLTPSNVIYNINVGDTIRYFHNGKVSCASIVVKIIYNGIYQKIKNPDGSYEMKYDKTKSYIEKIILKSTNLNSIWVIYPENYYILKLIKNKYRSKLDIAKLIQIDPSILKKLIPGAKQTKNIIDYKEITKDNYVNTDNINDAANIVDKILDKYKK